LTLGDTLGSQLPVWLKEVGAFASIPRGWLLWLLDGLSWMTGPTATSFVNPSPVHHHGSGWRGRSLVSTSIGDESLTLLGAHEGQVADPVIEAGFSSEVYTSLEAISVEPP
jgi:hypothetical protein